MLVWTGFAEAGGRKRIIVLDFEGPKADRFHDDIVAVIKKNNHTVVSSDKWTEAADKLGVTKVNSKSVKKVAHKLKIDGVITGKVEERDGSYIIQIKLREGKSGAQVGDRIDTKSDSPKLDSKAKRDIADELIAAIETLEENHGGDDDGGDSATADAKDAPKDTKDTKDAKDAPKDTDAKDKHFGRKDGMDAQASTATDDAPPPKHKHDKDPDATATSAGSGDDHPHHHHHDTASTDGASPSDDGASVTATADIAPALGTDEALTPGNRAVDVGLGLSFTARHLTFHYGQALVGGNAPPEYKEGLPVAGGILDATIFPFAITHKTTGLLADLGIEVMYDKVAVISSKEAYIDADMTQQTASLNTVEDHFAIGGVFRYPVTPDLVLGAKLMYMHQQFSVAATLPNDMPSDIPNVGYGATEPRVFTHYSVTPSLIINAEAGFMLITSTGGISDNSATGYGRSSDKGYEFNAGIDYHLTRAIFARANLHLEIMTLKFDGSPSSLSNTRDNDPTTQDVFGATDEYWGGDIEIGYAY